MNNFYQFPLASKELFFKYIKDFYYNVKETKIAKKPLNRTWL